MITGCWQSDKPKPTPTPSEAARAESWFYQLQDIELDSLRQNDAEVLVIDPSRRGDGDQAGFWTGEEINSLHRQGKKVIAYFSIGEAEDYRNYWKKSWRQSPPPFLNRANVEGGYANNYLVEYWHPEWHSILLSRLEKLQALGFDGVYLDKVDAFEDWQSVDSSKNVEFLKEEMVELILAIGEAGRSRAGSEFQLFLQNGWDLWSEPKLQTVVTGVGIEEFTLGWEGVDGQETPSSTKRQIEEALQTIPNWRVLIVDYPSKKTSEEEKELAREEARRVGAFPFLTDRALKGEPQ